ncbi:TIGR03643 family protein [Rhodocytophaga rosea]|uniref:TIGR03643 family protein n=1 Tax=Rhodocytophaga rosea TaxID=2704465 RepID=A0A6C0GPZ9_9BACT|nr:TIGR03643 family protein [Rhodocytophaga rosea]QHT70121.1 TIGR03643 family protein [Rhodocytophaga rosea]
MSDKQIHRLTSSDMDRIIEMAWEDRTPFEAIEFQFGLSEQEVIVLMRKHLKPSSWRMWRSRVQGRVTKHLGKRLEEVDRFKCSRQKSVSLNRISKRH